MSDKNRRDFLKLAAIAASSTSVGLGPSASGAKTSSFKNVALLRRPKREVVRFGIIGVGMRGSTLLRLLLAVDGAKITAICDIDQEALAAAAGRVETATGERPALYGENENSYLELCERNDVDAVMVITPWRWHLPMAMAAMQADKDTFVEVPAALNEEDCWQLVNESEKRQVHCMMMENVCYGYSELLALNMVRDGLLGELTHAEGAYIHNLRWLLDDHTKGEGSWRPDWYEKRIGNAYPTHGLGPIAQYFDINRGDRFSYIVSMSSPSRSFAAYADSLPDGDRNRDRQFVLGDMSSSMIMTDSGRTILLQHDIATPRPYSRINLVQGTKGTFRGYPDRLALDSVEAGEKWIEDLAPYKEKYESSLWRRLRSTVDKVDGVHGGMDYVMLWRMVHCLRNGLPLDQNVYDAAAWSVIFDLSEQSARNQSKRIKFPDFTRGKWRETPPLTLEAAESSQATNQ